VFFGTRTQIGEYDDIGAHEVTLFAVGDAPEARLSLEVVCGDHLVTLGGLPETIELTDGVGSTSFSVTIDPVDAAFHMQFDALLARGLVRRDNYRVAADAIRAVQLRALAHHGKAGGPAPQG
jgi:hypothetical protein